MLSIFFKWFSRTRFWLWFSSKIIANLNIRFFGYSKFPIEKYFEICQAILKSEQESPGIYAFAESDRGSFGGWFICKVLHSRTSHAGIIRPETITSDLTNFRIAHVKGVGFLDWHLLQILKEADIFSLVKYEFASREERDVAVNRIFEFYKEKPQYDFQQEIETDKKIYCSELVYKIMKDLPYRKNSTIMTVKTQRRLQRDVFEPDDVIDCATSIVWTNIQ
jgi:hypothetical protein